jgi:anti-anti-sigma factor
MKGSHSMSGYHSFELCYLAAVYTNLLITKQHLDLYFKPLPASFPDKILRVAPDMLPKGSIRIEFVEIEGKKYTDFDAEKLQVRLPESQQQIKVKVRIEPTSGLEHFDVPSEMDGDVAKVTVSGALDARAVPHFREELAKCANAGRLVLVMSDLQYLSPEGARALIFHKQKMSLDEDVFAVGAQGQPREILDRDEFSEEVTYVSNYAAAKSAKQ